MCIFLLWVLYIVARFDVNWLLSWRRAGGRGVYVNVKYGVMYICESIIHLQFSFFTTQIVYVETLLCDNQVVYL
jgi:hypothetical protein